MSNAGPASPGQIAIRSELTVASCAAAELPSLATRLAGGERRGQPPTGGRDRGRWPNNAKSIGLGRGVLRRPLRADLAPAGAVLRLGLQRLAGPGVRGLG